MAKKAKLVLRAILVASVVGLIWVMVSRADLPSVWNSLSNITGSQMIGLLALMLLYTWASASQLKSVLCDHGVRLRVLALVAIQFISGFYSTVLPGGALAGVTSTWWRLLRSSRDGMAAGLTIVFLRLLDVTCLGLLCVIGAWMDNVIATPAIRGLLLAVLACTLAGIGVMMRPPMRIAGVSLLRDYVISNLPLASLQTAAARIADSLDAAETISRRGFAQAILWGLVLHVFGLLTWSLMIRSVNIDLSLFTIFWTYSFKGFIQLLPLPLGGIGVREGGLILLLSAYGVASDDVLALGLVALALTAASAAIGGICEACIVTFRPQAFYANDKQGA